MRGRGDAQGEARTGRKGGRGNQGALLELAVVGFALDLLQVLRLCLVVEKERPHPCELGLLHQEPQERAMVKRRKRKRSIAGRGRGG